jgi:integrase
MDNQQATRCSTAAKLVNTGERGIYRRHAADCHRVGRCECPYVVSHDGTSSTFRTMTDAREAKRVKRREAKLVRAHDAGLHRDESRDECPTCEHERVAREDADPSLHVYALEWVERYQGTGRRGYREETRDEDRRLLKKYALKFFREDQRVRPIGPRLIADFISWLAKQPSRRGGKLSDKSVRNALQPVSSCLATARREGLIDHNPCDSAVLPNRPVVEEDEDGPRPFPRVEIEKNDGEREIVETMELVVSLVKSAFGLMFELLAATGLRRSELIAVKVRDLLLDGDEPCVKVRRRIRRRRGEGLVEGPPKSRFAKRDLPIPVELAERLAAHIRGRARDDYVFATSAGNPFDPDNLSDRVLAPACKDAGVEWAGFHTFRHTVASRLFAEGRNVVQVQRWLGHHSPSFTLDTYVHLLDGDLGESLGPRQCRRGCEDSAPGRSAEE